MNVPKTYPWQLGFISLIWVIAMGCESATSTPELQVQTVPVRLSIDFGGRRENISVDVRIPDKSSVLDALVEAESEIGFPAIFRGAGATAFVTSIGGQENENAGGANWVYYVNGELAKESCGTFQLHADDHVVWKFKTKGLQ